MKLNTTELRSFFYGTLLGDSHIHNNTFYCRQVSEDLIRFKAKIIDQYLPDATVMVREHRAYTDKNGVYHRPHYTLSASRSEYIKKLRELFYPAGKHVAPPDVVQKLTPLGLAMWYADDGTTILVQRNSYSGSAKSRRVQLCTDRYSPSECEQMCGEFQRLGYSPTILHRSEKFQRLQFIGCDQQRLMLAVGPYFYQYFPSLLYKMDLGYRNQSLDNATYVMPEYKHFYLKMSAHPQFRDRLAERRMR